MIIKMYTYELVSLWSRVIFWKGVDTMLTGIRRHLAGRFTRWGDGGGGRREDRLLFNPLALVEEGSQPRSHPRETLCWVVLSEPQNRDGGFFKEANSDGQILMRKRFVYTSSSKTKKRPRCSQRGVKTTPKKSNSDQQPFLGQETASRWSLGG